MIPTPAVEILEPTQGRSVRVLGWSILAVFGGAIVYSLFSMLTGMESSLIGIPVGLAVGQTMYYASSKHGGRWFQVLAVLMTLLAFDLTYAPGMVAIAFRHGITVPGSIFLVFMT